MQDIVNLANTQCWGGDRIHWQPGSLIMCHRPHLDRGVRLSFGTSFNVLLRFSLAISALGNVPQVSHSLLSLRYLKQILYLRGKEQKLEMLKCARPVAPRHHLGVAKETFVHLSGTPLGETNGFAMILLFHIEESNEHCSQNSFPTVCQPFNFSSWPCLYTEAMTHLDSIPYTVVEENEK